MKIRHAAAMTAALALCAIPTAQADNRNRDATPNKFVGVYAVQGEIVSISGPLGTSTCEEFKQFVPETVCTTAASIRLAADGSALLSAAGTPPVIGQWRQTGRRSVEVRSLNPEANDAGEPQAWSVAMRQYDFARQFGSFEGRVEIKNFPLVEDPSSPTVSPNFSLVINVEGVRFE